MTSLRRYIEQNGATSDQLDTLVEATARVAAKRSFWEGDQAAEEFLERAGCKRDAHTDLQEQLREAAERLANRTNAEGLSEQLQFLEAESVEETDILEHLELSVPFQIFHARQPAYRYIYVFRCLAKNEAEAEAQFVAMGGRPEDVSDILTWELEPYFSQPDEADQRFILFSDLEERTMNGKGFWNIRKGWVTRKDASVFSREEALAYALPQSLGQDRVWLDVTRDIAATSAAA
ncbi:hypothetical protein [Marinobacter sp. MBR-105]|jgi:hypothetical protein